jgi:hypothetical protein
MLFGGEAEEEDLIIFFFLMGVLVHGSAYHDSSVYQ